VENAGRSLESCCCDCGWARVCVWVVAVEVEVAEGGRMVRSADACRLCVVRVPVVDEFVALAPCEGGRRTVEGLSVVAVVVLLARVCVGMRLAGAG
jgi:hypothetical protein